MPRRAATDKAVHDNVRKVLDGLAARVTSRLLSLTRTRIHAHTPP